LSVKISVKELIAGIFSGWKRRHIFNNAFDRDERRMKAVVLLIIRTKSEN
jgi:hypothetical protein